MSTTRRINRDVGRNPLSRRPARLRQTRPLEDAVNDAAEPAERVTTGPSVGSHDGHEEPDRGPMPLYDEGLTTAEQRRCLVLEVADTHPSHAVPRRSGGHCSHSLDGYHCGPSYVATLLGMSAERVTVSLPGQVRQSTQRVADQLGLSFSAVVAEALSGWLRARLVDAWLVEHQAAHGAFDEDELRALAAEAGISYVAPRREEPAA